jgi:hypothetical protein
MMSQVECWTYKDFLDKCSEYGMLLDQQVTKGSTRWKKLQRRCGNVMR